MCGFWLQSVGSKHKGKRRIRHAGVSFLRLLRAERLVCFITRLLVTGKKNGTDAVLCTLNLNDHEFDIEF